MQSLAEHLGIKDPAPPDPDPHEMTDADIAGMSVQDFCRGVLRSRDYRLSLLLRVRIGELPPAIESLIYHYAEGKPVDRVEHTGREGGPIQISQLSATELAIFAAKTAAEAAALEDAK